MFVFQFITILKTRLIKKKKKKTNSCSFFSDTQKVFAAFPDIFFVELTIRIDQ